MLTTGSHYQLVRPPTSVGVEFKAIAVGSLTSDEIRYAIDQACHQRFPLDKPSLFRVRLFTGLRNTADDQLGLISRCCMLDADLTPEDSKDSGASEDSDARARRTRRGDVAFNVLVLSCDAIIADFWSMTLLLDDLRTLYQSASTSETGQYVLPATPFTYLDYTSYQHAQLSGDLGKQLWAFWQNQLAGALPVLLLPVDKPRPAVMSFSAGTRSFRIPRNLTAGLKDLANQQATTLYTTLLAAFEAFLFRYTHQEDIVIGSVLSCRDDSETHRIMGPFSNPVVFRARMTGNPIFRQYLDDVRRNVIQVRAHQEFPLALLLEKLGLAGDLAKADRAPLFQVMFIFGKSAEWSE